MLYFVDIVAFRPSSDVSWALKAKYLLLSLISIVCLEVIQGRCVYSSMNLGFRLLSK